MLKNILLCFLLVSCVNSSKNGQTNESNNTETTQVYSYEKKKESSLISSIKTIEFDKSLLEGVWFENERDNAWFWIQKDSVVFVEHQEPPGARL